MKYDDLLNVRYKAHGRGNGGYDCYGLAVECCRRAGTPLKDIYYEVDKLPIEQVNDYIKKGVNIKKIEKPKKHCLVEMEYKGNLHIGFFVERNVIIHATFAGVKTTTPALANIKAYYEVINESDFI